MRILAVIPARYHSQRLPGKVLLPLRHKPIIQHVYERARQVFGDECIVATDDMRVVRVVEDFGGRAIMTRSTHTSGTERIGEVAEKLIYDAYVNIQADEPFIEPDQIRLIVELLRKYNLVSLMTRIHRLEELLSPSVVKVVTAKDGRALYFSRSLIPHPRDLPLTSTEVFARHGYFRHIGLYGYYRSVLMEICGLSTAPPEEAEQLEQLRWLYHGYSVWLGETSYRGIGIDTPEDYEAAEQLAQTLL
ncbi:MAG: 3-deoxy-manno-octulosonate cytidylyltransferase [Bacteroidia bacterium]|nr:3-deoxy-manno-octulosonate cytidylyltransferase [Bacteroidia bacterium]MCX7652251.1 3-deoxy-manno-octulosonate cytidylyltransferase [Bacteroidia bacterium]MDW8416513.1 3-deoxy-manno-octulosonate cytidylyltransferase [Bacteroidia bacterium]